MVTGLQSYNSSPASGFSVSFNEETSPHYKSENDSEREGGGALSPDSQICCNDCKSVKKLSFKVNRDCRFASLVDTWTLKSQYSKIFSQRLEVNWMRFLLLNLLTACHLNNRPSVFLCSGLPHGSKLKANLFLQIFPQQTLGNDMCWNILLSYLLRKTPRGRWILLMLALAPC